VIEPILTIGAMAVVGGVSYLISRSNQKRRTRVWLDAAMACGLRDVTPSAASWSPTRVTAAKGGLDVEIERYTRGKHSHGTRVTVSGLHGVAPLGLQAEDFGTALRKGLGGTREVEIGDPGFDSRFLIEGPAPLALAVLDADTRRLVETVMGGRTMVHASRRDWLEGKAELARGKLTVEFPEGISDRVEQHLAGALATILALADHLKVRRDVPRQLAENALHDPLWAVRLANLRTLARECQTHPETSRMLKAARSDPSEEIRLTAALALGPAEGDATLLQLAFGDAPDAISARATAALGTRLPVPRAIEGLSAALAAGRLETAAACVEVLSWQADGPDATGAEPHLIRAVTHEDERLRIAAVKALGRLGTVRAVIVLREAADQFGGELRRASRQAVAEIQARAKGATPGQVSLSEGQAAGAVSLAREAGGEVTLPTED
jgi:hypothetical protein